MSYIRCLSNPEGLYVFGGKEGIEFHVGHDYKHTNVGEHGLVVPGRAFFAAVKKWDEVQPMHEDPPIKYRGFEIGEVLVYEDDGSPVPEKRTLREAFDDKRQTWWPIRFVYKDKFILMWQVTWHYVARDVLADYRRPKRKRATKKTRAKKTKAARLS